MKNVTEDDYGGSEEASRKGRFRVTSSSSSGPPETLGRFRLTPQNQFQSTSPCLQRGRFAVIPEEPGSTGGSQSNELARRNNRSPSPDWDFDTDCVGHHRD
ncbi:hypothetical protein Bhyg_16659 [Pseudolycoriella hygida]|uniref:Uncharacterized protein n=1 Tax=Pseudolycoriella hygida TaxID=35572 RepID=A0A9Q0MMK3_9DIPT|nr:hypothetical protein Bhyg_16659 [Pseudolycoriella hygida]